MLYRKILHAIHSKLQSRSRFFIDCSDQSHDLWKWRNLCIFYCSVHVTSQQSSSLLMCKVKNKQVRVILNWIFSLIYSLINVLQDTTCKLNTVYISQYMSRSSIIAMTNHMIIMVCESDILYVRFYLYHAKSLLLYLIQSPFVIQPQAIFVIIMCCYPCHTM